MAEPRRNFEREGRLSQEASGRGIVRFRIDGRDAVAPAGSTILEAAGAQGISIPTLCHHPALGPCGSCRVCLVEVRPSADLVPACSTTVTEGLECWTDSEAVARARADRIELLLANHPLDCPVCDRSGDCRLQDLAFAYGRDAAPGGEPRRTGEPRALGERLAFRPERCVLCLRCVRFAEEVSGTPALYVDGSRGPPRVEVAPGSALDDELWGNLLDLCPVGAIADAETAAAIPAWLVERRATICTECARGCAIEAQVFRGRVVRIAARANPAVNGFWICDRGRRAIDPVGGRKRRVAPS
ncbi:MAG: 2Fe-2S iron-sulfur cluster-binding protein, partial [Planctomycetota bacterium]